MREGTFTCLFVTYMVLKIAKLMLYRDLIFLFLSNYTQQQKKNHLKYQQVRGNFRERTGTLCWTLPSVIDIQNIRIRIQCIISFCSLAQFPLFPLVGDHLELFVCTLARRLAYDSIKVLYAQSSFFYVVFYS